MKSYIDEFVGWSFDEGIAKELFARFRGRARPVALLASELRKSLANIKNAADPMRVVLDIALRVETVLLDPDVDGWAVVEATCKQD